MVGFCSCFQRLRNSNTDPRSFWHVIHSQVIPSFASGALLATTVFLLIPESLELLASGTDHSEAEHLDESLHRRYLVSSNETDHYLEDEEHQEEEANNSGAAWKFGSALLGGFLLPVLLNAIFSPPDISNCEKCREQERQLAVLLSSNLSPAALDVVEEEEEKQERHDEEDALQDACEAEQTTMDLNCDDGDCACHEEETGHGTKTLVEPKKRKEVKQNDASSSSITATHNKRNIALASSILLGDFFHNFCDGIFIGTAFLLCSKSLAYTITVTTIYHEIAQEIADFSLLTHHCGFSRCQATLANFIAGCSVMIGAVIALSTNMSDTAIGVILALSAGVYIYIAAGECIPKIQAARKQARDTLLVLACFVVGAVPIGLVLLSHGHCERIHADDH
jgi:zinc transporter ZupT